MINVAEVISSSDLAQSFTVYRYSTGAFGRGGYAKGTPTTLTMIGVVTVAKQKELLMVPEGDRVHGAMVFYSTAEIYITSADGAQYPSDEIVWNGHLYKVVSVAEYKDYGYWKAVAQRIQGA